MSALTCAATGWRRRCPVELCGHRAVSAFTCAATGWRRRCPLRLELCARWLCTSLSAYVSVGIGVAAAARECVCLEAIVPLCLCIRRMCHSTYVLVGIGVAAAARECVCLEAVVPLGNERLATGFTPSHKVPQEGRLALAAQPRSQLVGQLGVWCAQQAVHADVCGGDSAWHRRR